MSHLNKIVNLNLHPINRSDEYLSVCHNKLKSNSLLQLDDFLLPKALKIIQNEAKKLYCKSFHSSKNHTVLLYKKDNTLNNDDPCNIVVNSNKSCVPDDLIPYNSLIRLLYNSTNFRKFIETVFGIDKIYPYRDTLASINYNYYGKNQQLGWHFDNAYFTITLMIESPISGGIFQYINKVRDFDKNYINKNLLKSVLTNTHLVNELSVQSGTLVLFYGRNSLHRVTPVTSDKYRVLVTLNYNLEKNIMLSENARLTFFGRLK
jgi:hypothetical protein